MATREPFGLDSLALPESLQEAVQHGEVFTRRWVVEMILDTELRGCSCHGRRRALPAGRRFLPPLQKVSQTRTGPLAK